MIDFSTRQFFLSYLYGLSCLWQNKGIIQSVSLQLDRKNWMPQMSWFLQFSLLFCLENIFRRTNSVYLHCSLSNLTEPNIHWKIWNGSFSSKGHQSYSYNFIQRARSFTSYKYLKHTFAGLDNTLSHIHS